MIGIQNTARYGGKSDLSLAQNSYKLNILLAFNLHHFHNFSTAANCQYLG